MSSESRFETQAKALQSAQAQIAQLRNCNEELQKTLLASQRVNDSLIAREQHYRALFDAHIEGLIFSAMDGRVLDANPAACQMHGYSREEFLKLMPRDFVHPDYYHLYLEYVRTAGAGEPFYCQAKDVRKDGSAFDVEVYGALIMYEGHSRLLGIVRDISELKRSEEKMAQQEAMLAHVSRLSTMGELVAGIAHEVSQPLYSIQNFAKATLNLLSHDENLDVDLLQEWNQEIVAASGGAAEIIRRLRDFVRRHEVISATAEVNDIVRESLELVLPETKRAAVFVTLDLDPTMPMVTVDRVQIQQVVVNLLKNAIESFPESNADRRISIRTEGVHDGIIVSVRDNGPGFPPHHENLFSPFVTTKPDGMGMGLAISQTIIEAHRGRLWIAENDATRGEILFWLPAKQELDE